MLYIIHGTSSLTPLHQSRHGNGTVIGRQAAASASVVVDIILCTSVLSFIVFYLTLLTRDDK